MNLIQLSQQFNTQHKCIAYMEKLRWGTEPVCMYCGSRNTVSIKTENRNHCNNCKRSFSVFVGTIFEDCRLPMPKFFILIALMLDAKKGISAMQLTRSLGVSYKTSWYAAMRVRCAMVETINDLQGIIEADESYLGGRPKKKRYVSDNTASLSQIDIDQPKRGRGTSKTKIAGFVERDGRVVTKVLKRLTSQNLMAMLRKYVKEDESVLITDEYKGYSKFDELVQHLSINHSKEYAKGNVHINTIEGYWNIVKAGLRGQYHVLSKKYLPFYLAEWSYKYNRRNFHDIQFESFLKDALSDNKCFLYYKPKNTVTKITYPVKIKPAKANVNSFKAANKEAGRKRVLSKA